MQCISIHSLRMEGDNGVMGLCGEAGISIHSLRMEGDPKRAERLLAGLIFQSTPSAWRETAPLRSIFPFSKHFNPLPPHGGRLDVRIIGGIVFCISIHSLRMEGDDREISFEMTLKVFQSTPSAWRETTLLYQLSFTQCTFQSTPSAWRETRFTISDFSTSLISIHSLRMEGDACNMRRHLHCGISIHSLRMEGDFGWSP